METGDLEWFKGTVTGRWCGVCDQWHGPLYNCEKYPEELRKKIEKLEEEFRSNPILKKNKSKYPGGTITQIYADIKE